MTGRAGAIALAFVAAIAAGCSDGGSGAPITDAVVAGTLEGPLADEIMAEIARDDPAEPPSVIIGEGDDAQASELARDAMEQHVPVVVVGADTGEIAELRAMAGLPSDGAPSHEGTELPAYAVDRDADGDLYELVVTTAPPPGKVRVVGVADDGTTPLEVERDADPVDEALGDQALVSVLLEWLRDDGERSDDDTASAELATALDLDGVSAEQLDKRLDEVALSTERRSVFKFRTNVHTVTTTVWGAHSRSTGEDWFYVRQKGGFSAINEIVSDSFRERGRYTYFYDVDTAVDGWESNAAVFVDQSTPDTAEGVAKISSKASWKLEGEVGLDLKSKGEGSGRASTSIGVSIDNTYSYEVKDVTVRNLSQSRLNNARWRFDIARPYFRRGFFCIGADGFGEMVPVSKSTFQPYVQWIWRVSSAVRNEHPGGLPVRIDLRTGVALSTGGGPGCLFREELEDSATTSDRMTVPWPPRP
jgi:hypothetical protein